MTVQKSHYIDLREFDKKTSGIENLSIPNEPQKYELYSNETYFAFVDVLGFSDNYLQANESDNKDTEDSDIYDKVFRYYFSLIDSSWFSSDRQREKDWYAGQISDSLYFYTKDVEILCAFIKLYSHFNLYAMSQNVFFRGGIALGKLYTNDLYGYRYYGDCVINAYRMESEIAGNPAVYIDEKTYNVLKTKAEIKDMIYPEDSTERHYIMPFVGKYTDYTNVINPEKGIELEKIDMVLIENNIEKQRKRNEFSKNYDKYIFLIKESKR